MRDAITMRLFSLAFFLLFLGGCATGTAMKGELEKAKAGESVVFGHVDVIVDGKKQEWGQGWTGAVYCSLIILPDDSTHAVSNRISDDGMFYLSLKPGNYHLLGFRLQQGTQHRVGRIDARFTVPDGSAAVYIGNITIDMKRGYYRTRVVNNMLEPAKAYKSKYPGRTGTIATSLIQLTTRIGNYSRIAGVCNSRWGVDCKGDFKGVTPVTPAGKVTNYPETDSLTPTFSWKPVTGKGVSYDLIIFEAATYRYPGGSGLSPEQTMKGRMVLYKENIRNASYKLQTALKPKTRYFWSVRFRDQAHNLVSGWSTYSHITFIPFIYMSSGYGAWFTFRTP
ncbi:MAG: hypothetical protein P8Z75_06820 [Gammaproteobacteria bacterium]